jgi:hypothetical protein
LDEDNDGIPGMNTYMAIWNSYGSPVYKRGSTNVKAKVTVSGGIYPYNFDYTLSNGVFSIQGTDTDHNDNIEITLSDKARAPIGRYGLTVTAMNVEGQSYSTSTTLYVIFNSNLDFSNPPDIGYATKTTVATNHWGPPIKFTNIPDVYTMERKSYISPSSPEIFLKAVDMVQGATDPYDAATRINQFKIKYGLKYRGNVCYDTDIENLNRGGIDGINCAGFTVVFVSMCRALGIPVREVIIDVSIWVVSLSYHEIAEVYNGLSWTPFEPQGGYSWWFFKSEIKNWSITSVRAYGPSGEAIDRTSDYVGR